ncbi:MAG: hypothetical protein RLZZ210_959 [Pseudomonadota bacterium]|jgi:predicted transposase/invertase (TIGR01784 family)
MYADVFMNPFTDFGFKKLFSEESSKPYLLDFLNSILPQHHHIKSFEYSKNEHFGFNEFDRKSIVDIKCLTNNNETIIIELQKAKQNYFKDRSIYYASFPIIEQAKKGDWDYKLNSVYTIGILDFTFSDDEETVIHTVNLKNQKNQVFYDKLTFIYLTMPNFRKQEFELETNQDKWLYLFKNMALCNEVPQVFKHNVIFEDVFEKSKLLKLSHAEQETYRNSLKNHLDLYNSINTAKLEAREEGKAEGIAEGRAEGEAIGIEKGKAEGQLEAKQQIAKSMKGLNISIDVIIQATGLSKADIEVL